jgi:hypothetical protein
MSISHKKMKEIQSEISKLIEDTELTQKIYEILKEKLKYDENKKYTYDKDEYEKYGKVYYEKNKKEINKNRYERLKKQKEIERQNNIN